jgi:hypothetical protein
MGRPESDLPAGRATVGGLVVLNRQLEDAALDAAAAGDVFYAECVTWVENCSFPVV